MDTQAPEPSSRQLALLMDAIDTKVRSLADHFHPDWIERALRDLDLSANGRRGSALLSAAYELRWPSLEELREPVHRISLLERPQILRVLAVHALDACRDRVRMSIGRETREILVSLVGSTAHGRLVESPPQGVADAQPLAPHELDLDVMAAAGFRRLCRGGAWISRDAMAITRLSLAPVAVDQSSGLEEAAAASTLEKPLCIDEYFPELSWLFGSDMDRSLSA